MSERIRISDAEFAQRAVNLQKAMAVSGLDAVLCYGNEAEPQYVRYFSDYWPSFETAGVLVPREGKPYLLIGPESQTYATDRSRIADIRLLKAFRESSEPEYPGKPLDTFASVFDELGFRPAKIGVAGLPLMTIGVWNALVEYMGDASAIVKADALVNELRMHKTETELACMREAARITRLTFDAVIPQLHVGMTEQQVVGLALGEMHRLGAERESYPLWALTGKGGDQAISRPRAKAIEKGDLTFLQFGARYEGYASSIGRAVVFGKADEYQRKLIECGYAAQNAVLANIRAGVPAAEIARIHEETVKGLGFGDHLLYGPCHGNGLMEGEAPWIETNSDYLLEENMTFCLDIFLGTSRTGFGLRMEDVIRVTKDGVENLTSYPQKLWELA